MNTLRRNLRAAILCAALTLAALGYALAGFEISGAIVATGEVRTTINRQPVQHPTGGVVLHSFVKDGQKVSAGQELLHLTKPEVDAEIARLSRRDRILKIEMARLIAERDENTEISLGVPLANAIAADPELRQVLETHRGLLAERRALEAAFDASLTASGRQLDAEISGLSAQLAATQQQLALIDQQRAIQQDLVDQGLAPSARLTETQRERAAAQAQVARFQTDIAQAAQRRAALQVEKLSARTTARENAISMLAQLRRDHLALGDRLAELRTMQDATILRAPFDGWVSDAMALSEGAILGAGQTAFVVIPNDQNLIVQARVTPRFARQIKANHPVWFRLAGPGSQDQTELNGRVLTLSADAISDEGNPEPYFLATISAPASHPDMVPGTPAEVFFATPPRTVWAYIAGPLRQYFGRSLRET